MSDPVTNSEIEDVLSSIRRLVSEDGRKASEPVSTPAPEATTQKLVLTPALRVEALPFGHSATKAAAKARALGESDESAEPSSEPLQLGDAASVEADVDENVETTTSETVPPAEPATADAPFVVRSDLAAKIAELEAMIGQTKDQWEPDGESPDEYAGGPVEAFDWQEQDENNEMLTNVPAELAEEQVADSTLVPEALELDADLAIALEQAIESDATDPSVDEALQQKAETTEATEAQPEDATIRSAVAEVLQDAKPTLVETPAALATENDGAGEEDAEALNAEVQSEAETLSEGFSAAKNEQVANDENVDLFGADETLFDEAMLRDLVTEIVRQELQGALGERITRNVRKLVRREIHRAMASQDFE